MASINTVQPGWYSIPGAARYTGFSETAIRGAIEADRLPVSRVTISGSGKKDAVRIKREHLDAWIESKPFEIDQTGPHSETSAVPPGMRAVFIREEDFEHIRRIGEMVGIEDPVNRFVCDLIANTADDPGSLIELVEALRQRSEDPEEPPALPVWNLRGLHPNSKAYAQEMAAMLRSIFPEDKAAEWYRIIRCREIPPVPGDAANPSHRTT